ncbi:hypothetical protein [Paenibacillus qinlingensis]|uniref:hypothetical protein n=1 Tax=Paenibacillus qinlingensis TaxID=1837343 RepID=UPI00156491AD|nr:hypothetical protein [Paenibacillus qinlingensis]NQX62519.1 hypothetical protein [Paenibacillus qinlingensis]
MARFVYYINGNKDQLYNSNENDGNPIYQPLGYPERVIREKFQKGERAGVQAGAAANPAGAAAREGAAAAAGILGKIINWVKGLPN